MRIAELLALLGRSWARLFVYPGGLALACALLLIILARRKIGRVSETADRPMQREDAPAHGSHPRFPSTIAVSASFIMLPWLGLALLPLPRAVNIGQSVDVVMALALLEWPRLLLAADEYRQGHVARLAAALNSYPPLLMSLVLLALPTGSFDVTILSQLPAAVTPLPIVIAHWAGAAGLLLTLPVLLGVGPFACPAPKRLHLRLGLLLRGLGIGALTILPILALVPEDAFWLLPFPAVALATAVWGIQRLAQGHSALPWARALMWLVVAEVALAIVAGISRLPIGG